MIGTMTVRGVPRGLLRDAWWLSEEVADVVKPPAPPAPVAADRRPRLTRAAIALAVLLALGDLLFYGHDVGLSLALYAYAIFAASVAVLPNRGGVVGPAVLMFLAGLPVIEHLQALSVFLLAGGLITSIAWLRAGRSGLARSALRLWAALPVAGVLDGIAWAMDRKSPRAAPGQWRILALNWAVPLGGGMVLLSLLVQANPVLEGWLDLSLFEDWDLEETLLRLMFWTGLALVVWPFLSFTPPAPFIGPHRPRARATLGFNTASVANALIVFNLLLGLQTLMDIALLWGGGPLPEGMSHATYARRGAYPLLVTALLAGGFALAARPHLGGRKSLSALMMIWLAQNVLLTASAAYRLWVYVEVYGLTYLRLHAAIWMGLVAVGLVLIGWFIHARRPAAWLVLRGGGLALVTLYICAFINFAQIIAAYNLTHPSQDRGVDLSYACSLAPMAAVALQGQTCARAPHIDGWRDWGFRSWRVARLLAAAEGAYEDTRGR